jgi:ATP-dependent DNA helicase DinG
MSRVTDAFAVDGLLAKAINNFAPRAAQTEMAEKVELAIKDKSVLVVEAGTGTGKTFAYLLPALMTGKKVIVSTGTKNLQEQLFHKDLPVIKNALASNKQVALLKGRANYLCLFRLEQHVEQYIQSPDPNIKHGIGSNINRPDRQVLSDLVKVRAWAGHTQSGDTGELDSIAEDSPVFPYVTSTLDNCLAKDCPHLEDCYLVKARQNAMDADLVVVNHHLFFADMALKDTGFGELIPSVDTVIFDEAHQLGEIASDYFGQALSTRQLTELASDCLHEYRLHLTDVRQLQKAAEKLLKSAQDFRLLFEVDPQRGNWQHLVRNSQYGKGFKGLAKDLQFLYEVLKNCVSRTEAIDRCFERALELLAKFDLFLDVDKTGVSLWFETTRRHLVLHQTPLSIADKFGAYIENSDAGWVFTSATLAVDDNFNHFNNNLGLKPSAQYIQGSPFDYPQQSLLLIPRYLPEPFERSRATKLAAIAKPLIKASQGNCFILFTSYRMMNEVASLLSDQIDNPLLVQGQMAKRSLLEQFVKHQTAVLLATASFWEGVDVRGDNLTCVIIDKLPFAAPDDPLLQARGEDIKRQGGDPFKQMQLPQAVISLKQGVGRLIRDVNDRGVLAICDNRLVNRPYGQTFLSSLPAMTRTRELEQAVEFLHHIHQGECES